MPKTKEEKREIIKKLADKFKKAKVVIFSSFSQRGKRGLDVEKINALKNKLKEADSEYSIAKKTLIRIALESSLGKKVNVREFEGSIGLVFGYSKIIEPVKILNDFAKENEVLKIFSGIIEKEEVSLNELIEIANLGSKDVLIYRFVGLVKNPLIGLINGLNWNIRNLLFVLANIKK